MARRRRSRGLVAAGLNSAQLAAVRQADQQFAIEMKKLDIRLEEIEAGDRASARAREIAQGLLGGFFGTVYWALTGNIPTDPNKLTMIGMVIGYVSVKADQVVAYFFGSSAGSKQKTDAMAAAFSKLGKSAQ